MLVSLYVKTRITGTSAWSGGEGAGERERDGTKPTADWKVFIAGREARQKAKARVDDVLNKD